MLYKRLIVHPAVYSAFVRLRTIPIIVRLKNLLAGLNRLPMRPALPEHIVMDISSVCQLRCPFCPTGVRDMSLKRGFVDTAEFVRRLSMFPRLRSVSLFNWGEPFLNPDVLAIIRAAHDRGVRTDIDSNFSLKLSDAYLEGIIDSGLDVLRVSIDGASQKTYAAYRRNGDFSLAYGNMKRLRRMQRERGAATPVIYWKFLVHKKNEHEIDTAKRMAADIGVNILFDMFQFSEDLVDVRVTRTPLAKLLAAWLPTDPSRRAPHLTRGVPKAPFNTRPCPWLFSSLVVHTDGSILPCCYVASKKSAMGSVADQPIDEIWYAKKYAYARSLFTGVRVPREPVVCERCPVYRRRMASGTR